MSTKKRKVAKDYSRQFNRYVRHRIRTKLLRLLPDSDTHTKAPRNSGKWNAS